MFPIELNINVSYLKQSFQFREELLINPKNTKNTDSVSEFISNIYHRVMFSRSFFKLEEFESIKINLPYEI